MAFELYGMLSGNVSPMTGEHVKPAYGGEEEAFLKKVVTPIYDVIAKVLFYTWWLEITLSLPLCWLPIFEWGKDLLSDVETVSCHLTDTQEAARSRKGKSKHSQWRNYDDLNEYFWYYSYHCWRREGG